MENQGKFLEMLQEIKEIANSQNNHLTKEEIKNYLGDETLSEQKLQAVYHYLGENHIDIEGYAFVPDVKEASEQSKEKTSKNGKESQPDRRDINMKIYRDELEQILMNREENTEVIVQYLKGDDSVKNQIIEGKLARVIELAKRYEKRGVALDEIIAEGNVGLMMAMQIIEQDRKRFLIQTGTLDEDAFLGTIDMEITNAIELYIDEMTSSKDWEDTVLAKTNLLHEATKYMTEEIGRVPTIEELSEYTKISRKEIKDIMGLSEDAKRVATPDM